MRQEKLYRQRMHEYEVAKERAKWCTITELATQSSDLVDYLDSLTDIDKSHMDEEEFRIAREQAGILKAYFEGAIEANIKLSEGDEIASEARKYARKSSIPFTINIQSGLTYAPHKPIEETKTA